MQQCQKTKEHSKHDKNTETYIQLRSTMQRHSPSNEYRKKWFVLRSYKAPLLLSRVTLTKRHTTYKLPR